jgi:hypothetical protein
MKTDDGKPFTFDDGSYREYARKMDLFMDGPTTTYFDQLVAAGVELPEPDVITDTNIRAKLWEVIAALASLRVVLDQTDHLSDRALYQQLFDDLLRGETPAIDDIGFTSHLSPLRPGERDADTMLYLKYYADDQSRTLWAKDFPEDAMPAHEDPPFDRDALLPAGPTAGEPEALAWLRANWSASAFATNRFQTTAAALDFVRQLYDAGARFVAIDNAVILPNHQWTPYADTLIVDLPGDPAARRELFDLMEHVGRPDEDAGGRLQVCGESTVRLWCD